MMTGTFQIDTSSLTLEYPSSSPQLSGVGHWVGGTAEAPYQSGRLSKQSRYWVPLNWSGDSAIRASWQLTVARIRDLVRNDPVIGRLVAQRVNLAIGDGILTFSAPRDAQGFLMEGLADESDDRWKRWSLEEADASGRMTFFDMQAMVVSELFTAGGCLLLRVSIDDPRRSSPLAFQILELEQLDVTKDRPPARGRTRIEGGKEFGANGRVIAYWLFDVHPHEGRGIATGNISRRIPADRIIDIFIPHRPSAHSGISKLTSVAQQARDREQFLCNALNTSTLHSGMAIHVKSETARDQGSQFDTSSERQNVKDYRLGYPSVITTGVNEDVNLLTAAAPDPSQKDWLRTLYLQTAMGGNLSYNRLVGDPGETVFAAIRAAFIDDERVSTPLQQNIAFRMVLPIRRLHQDMAAAMGQLSVSPAEYLRNRERLSEFDWIAAKDPDIQPKEDGEAAIDRLRSGRSTPQVESGRLGFHFRNQLRQWRDYFRLLESNGFSGYFDYSKGNGGLYIPLVGPVDATGQEQGQEVEQEVEDAV